MDDKCPINPTKLSSTKLFILLVEVYTSSMAVFGTGIAIVFITIGYRHHMDGSGTAMGNMQGSSRVTEYLNIRIVLLL